MNCIPSDYPDRRICILGMGYVGLTLATVMAESGFEVLGIEIRDDVLEKLRRGEPHFFEPGMLERLKKVVDAGQLTCFKHIPQDCDARVYIITVGTPLGQDGRVRLDMIRNVSEEISRHLRADDLVIIRSTVKLGTSKNIVEPLLAASGVPFDLAFCPERTIEGNALAELTRLPQIVGGVNHKSQLRAAQLFHFLTPTIVRVSGLEAAEMIKMVDNSYRDVYFAYANEIARICDVAGVSAIEVINAGKLGYPRVSIPLPGLVGGPCLSKDPYILEESLAGLPVSPDITMAARKINESQPDEVVRHLRSVLASRTDWPGKPVIALLGMAFKGRPATDDLRGTMALPVFEAIKRHFPEAAYTAYDAMVKPEVLDGLGLVPRSSLADALAGANLALILNNSPEFETMPVARLAAGMARPGLIYDFWNNFTASALDLPSGVGYMALGSHRSAVLP